MAGIALGTAFLAGAAVGWPALPVVVPAVALLLVGSRQRRRLALPAALVLLAAGLGVWRGGFQGVLGRAAEAPPTIWADAAVGAGGWVVTPPTASGRRQGFDLALAETRLEEPSGARSWGPADGLVCASAPALPVVRLGDRVRLAGEIRPIADLSADLRAALRARGCAATLFASWSAVEQPGAGFQRAAAEARRRLTDALRAAAPGDAGALLAGLVTGDDHALSEPRADAFIRTGTSHVTAVSGANVALVVAAAVALGRAGGWRRRLAWQIPTLAAIWGYALLTGLGSPVARAALVASGAVLAVRFGRRPDLVTLTVVAAAAMVAVDPAQLGRPSFQLSFVSALGIITVLAGAAPRGWLGWGTALAKGSIAAQLATLPVVLATFGNVSLVSLPANLLIGPLVAVAFPAAVVAAIGAAALPTFGGAVALPANVAAGAIFAVVDRLGAGEYAVWLTGRATVGPTLLLALFVAPALAALSPEGRAWARRCRHDWQTAGGGPMLAAGAAVGLGLGLVVAAFWP